MIPKIIHYCWFGGNKIPDAVNACIASWKKFCPDYEIILWNETNFDVSAHPFMKKAYENKKWAFVTDYARLKIVYENGGIYLDTDVELLKNLDDLLQEKCYFGLQQSNNLCNTGLGFGSEKGARILKVLMDSYDNIEFNLDDKFSMACPILNTKVLLENGYFPTTKIFKCDEFTIYPPRYFDPFSTQSSSNILCEDTYSIHHYSASWCSSNQRMKRKLVLLIGEERFIKMRKRLQKVFSFNK